MPAPAVAVADEPPLAPRRYEDVRQIMEEARPAILEKARKMGRGTS